MAESSRSSSFLAFIVGGLVVAVAVLGWFAYAGGLPFGGDDEASVTIKLPDVDVKE